MANIYGTSGALVNLDQPLLLDGTATIGLEANLFLLRWGAIPGSTSGKSEMVFLDTSSGFYVHLYGDIAGDLFTVDYLAYATDPRTPFTVNNYYNVQSVGFFGGPALVVDMTDPGDLSLNRVLALMTGDDQISGGTEADVLLGYAGNDTIYGGGGLDTMDGGAGKDTLYGDDGADVLNGGAGGDKMYGDAGNDTLRGGNGADTLFGGDDDDRLYGGKGNDSIDCGAGNDRAYGGAQGDTLSGGLGNDTLNGGGGADLIQGDGGMNRLLGGGGDDTIQGAGFDDKIFGGAGDDRLEGSWGADTLSGGSGADWIEGGPMNDRLIGGLGADQFVFETGDGDDQIVDFEDGADLIRITSGATGFADLTISWVAGGHTMVSFSDVSVLIRDVDISLIGAADFVFG